MALEADGGSFGRTGLAVPAAVTEAFGSVVGAGACAMVRATEPDKQHSSKTRKRFENGRKGPPTRDNIWDSQKRRAESVTIFKVC
jgi:hypothetical protein